MNVRLPFRRKSVGERGRAIYREKVRPLVYPQETGKMVLIDVCTGDYEVASDDWDHVPAADRLRGRRPDAVIWGERVGYKAATTFGGRLPLDDD